MERETYVGVRKSSVVGLRVLALDLRRRHEGHQASQDPYTSSNQEGSPKLVGESSLAHQLSSNRLELKSRKQKVQYITKVDEVNTDDSPHSLTIP